MYKISDKVVRRRVEKELPVIAEGRRDRAKMLTHHLVGERCHLPFQLLEAEFYNELSLYLSPSNYYN